MRRKGALLLACVIASVTLITSTSQAAVQVIVSGPGEAIAGTYKTPVVIVVRDALGQVPVDYINGDVAYHNVESVDVGPDTNPWCLYVGYPGNCPLFWSEGTGLSGRKRVLGLEQLALNTPYKFTCFLHSWMIGYIVVIESPH